MAMTKKSLTYVLYNYLYSRKSNVFTIKQLKRELHGLGRWDVDFDDILKAVKELDEQGCILHTATGQFIYRSHCLWQF